jgi:hypothetical protein
MFPLYKTGMFGEAGFVIAALVVGFGFGFFLERGGLANARKLTGQFYLHDFTVLRVMFTAIVVAMLGLLWLALLGWLDLSLVYLNPTRLWPMLVGGLAVGLGFAVGGYCPGTSVAAAVNGKLDAVVFMGGLMAGIAVYAWLFGALPALAAFSQAGDLGPGATLDGWLGLPPAVVAFLVVLMALGAFWGGSKLEARFGGGAPSRE